MNKGAYRTLFRRTMRDDLPVKPLWSNDEIDAFVQEAREEAARRSRRVKYTAASPLVVPMVNAQTNYQLPAGLFRITKVSLNGARLREETIQSFDYHQISRFSRLGSPVGYIVDEDNVLILDFSPLSSPGSLHVEGYFMPTPLAEDLSNDLAFDESDQTKLLYHAYSRAYLVQDSEAEHMQKSEYFDKQFENSFGQSVPFDTLRKQGQFSRRVVRYGGIQ